MPRLSLSTIFAGAIASQVRGGGVIVGLAVASDELELDTEVDLLGLRETEEVRDEGREDEGGMANVPAKL